MFGKPSVAAELRSRFDAVDGSTAIIAFASDGAILDADDTSLAATGHARSGASQQRTVRFRQEGSNALLCRIFFSRPGIHLA